MDHLQLRPRCLGTRLLLLLVVVIGMTGAPVFAQGGEDLCASEYVPLIQQAGLDVEKSAPAFGCRPDGRGGWAMPTVNDLADDPAIGQFDTQGRDLLATVDRMAMDDTFASSIRYDRSRAVVLTWGPGGATSETDISDVTLGRHPSWMNNYRDAYEQSMMTYLTRTLGDENDLVSYIEWLMSRRDVTLSVLASNMNPMLASAYLDNGNYQRAPWPWQLANPYAIAAYTGQDLSTSTGAEAVPSVEGRQAWLDVSPRLLRVVPGGTATYVVQPVIWGDWSIIDTSAVDIEVRIPSGVRLDRAPTCGTPASTMPNNHVCQVEISERGGLTIINLRTSSANGAVPGLTLALVFATDLEPGTTLGVQAVLSFPEEKPSLDRGEGARQSARVVVIDPAELAFSAGDDTVSGRVEFISFDWERGMACAGTSHPTDLVLYRWGDTPVLSRVPVSEGSLGLASDGTGRTACIIAFRFDGVPDASVYQVALVGAGETIPCRACILGTIPPVERAEPVFVLGE